MWTVHLALTLAALHAAVLAGMCLAQTRLLFPTALAGLARVQLPASAQRLEVRVPDGEVLAGVRIPAEGEEDEHAPTPLGSGGNAWDAEAMALHLHDLFPGRGVVAFHYRGDAPSGGRPSAAALLSDSVLVFEHLQRAHPHGRVVAIGVSIGSGVAAYLARHRPVAGLVPVTPFDPLEALARDLYRWAPVGLLPRHRMPTVDFVRGSPVPTALVVAERDRIVPTRRSVPLRSAVMHLVFEAGIEAGHDDLCGHPAFRGDVRGARADGGRLGRTSGR